jgi:hypothetical protein
MSSLEQKTLLSSACFEQGGHELLRYQHCMLDVLLMVSPFPVEQVHCSEYGSIEDHRQVHHASQAKAHDRFMVGKERRELTRRSRKKRLHLAAHALGVRIGQDGFTATDRVDSDIGRVNPLDLKPASQHSRHGIEAISDGSSEGTTGSL